MLRSEDGQIQRICLDCNHANRAFANFCASCGRQLPLKESCAACGAEVGSNQERCHACGALHASEKHPTVAPPEEQDDTPILDNRVDNRVDSRNLHRSGSPRETDRNAFAFHTSRVWRSFLRLAFHNPGEPVGLNEAAGRGSAAQAADASPRELAIDVGPIEKVRANVLWGVVAILSVIGGQLSLRSGQTALATGLYVFGIVLALWAFRRTPGFAFPATSGLEKLKHINPLWLIPVILLPGAAAAWSLERLLFNPERPPNQFWLLHIASILLFIGCVFFVERRHIRPTERSLTAPWTTGQRLVVIAIICIGLFMRMHELATFPPGAWYDEAAAGLEALRILEQPDYRPLYVSGLMGPEHYVYLVSFLFLILPKITFVVRLATVITGALSVPAAYLAGSHLFGRGPALAFAFLIAVSRWSVNFSRIGMYNIPMTLFVFLGAGLLFKALRRGRLTDFLWAGLCLGFGLNTYFAFQLFLAVISVFVLYLLISKKSVFLSHWKGLVVLAMGVLLFLAPLATFAYARLDGYLERTRTVSIFEEYPEDQVWGKVRESAASHLAMYNIRGDPNGRHNLPGEPMLAPVAGALLVLGLAISLSRIWRPRFFLLVLWFLGLLAGGVFSLSFEAPQSLRAIGTLPVVYILATVPLALLWQNWRAVAQAEIGQATSRGGVASSGVSRMGQFSGVVGGRFTRLLLWPGSSSLFLTALLATIAIYNYRAYFVRQMNDFAVWNAYSTGETIAATRIAGHIDAGDTDVYLTSHYSGHPSVRFVGSREPYYRTVLYTETLPMPLSPDRDALFLMDPERRNLYEQARGFYPNSEFIEHKPPFGGPTVLYEFRLKPSDISSIQGMNVAYFDGEAWEGTPAHVERDPEISVEWPREAPLTAPFSAEWSGVINITEYEPHKFVLRAPAAAELYVDEELVTRLEEGVEPSPSGQGGETSIALELALGLHSLRVRAVGGQGPVTLSWQRLGEEEEIVPTWALHVPPVSSNGLLGKYFPNGNWQDPVAFSRIDPQINIYFHDIPLPRPYTVEWSGKLAVPLEGVYQLGIESIDESELWIDGKEVAASVEPNQYVENPVTLTAGLHDIRIRYVARTSHYHVNLHWAPPGQMRQLIPSQALLPPKGSYADVVIEDLSIFEDGPGASLGALPVDLTLLPPDQEQTAEFELISDRFERPRGVAAANGRLYVVDPSLRAMFVLGADGRQIDQFNSSNRRFIEPVDVAVDSAGNVYVLDTGDGGRVSLHDPAGKFVRVIPISDTIVDRSRGLDVDNFGRIWLAMTAAKAVVAFNDEGRELIRISTALAETELQPVDVAYHADDAVYVSAVGTTSLVRFSIDGTPLRLWPLANANSVDGPHLSLDGEGNLYVTQPESGGFLRISAERSEDVEVWALPASQPVRKLVGISVSPEGSLFVTDSERGNVYRIPLAP